MAETRGKRFAKGERVEMDGGHFIDCHFERASLVYSGGEHPMFENCTFGDVGWRFDGAALRTIQLLQAIGAAPNGRSFLDDLFAPGKILTG
jgi:hypothetical protein